MAAHWIRRAVSKDTTLREILSRNSAILRNTLTAHVLPVNPARLELYRSSRFYALISFSSSPSSHPSIFACILRDIAERSNSVRLPVFLLDDPLSAENFNRHNLDEDARTLTLPLRKNGTRFRGAHVPSPRRIEFAAGFNRTRSSYALNRMWRVNRSP